MGEGKQADLEYSYRARVHINEFQPLAVSLVQKIHRFSTSRSSNFSTKGQNEKIRMAAAEQKHEVLTAEPLLAGFAVSCMK